MQKIHNYLLERQLCENEFVSVHIAVDLVSQKRFTLSIVNDDYQINPVFLMKVITGTSQHPFTHPHIAKIIDYGEVNQKQYFVSEYLGHRSLASFLEKPVPATFALDVISQLASGLHYISLQGYIHGHIRPDNVLFDKYGNVILSTTLLISNKRENVKASKTGASRYQSPEVVAGKNADECSDLYSLGVIFFELLTGEHFGERETNLGTDVENVNELIPYLPKDSFGFQPIINKLLAKNPKQRYQTGIELVDALNDYESKLDNTPDLNLSGDFYEADDTSAAVKKDPENTGKKRFKRLMADLGTSESSVPLDELKVMTLPHIFEAVKRKLNQKTVLVSVSVSSFALLVIIIFMNMGSKVPIAENPDSLIVSADRAATLQDKVNADTPSVRGNATHAVTQLPPNNQQLNTDIKSPVNDLTPRKLAQLKLANIPPLISILDQEFAIRSSLEQERMINGLLDRATQYKLNLKFTTPVKENAYAMYIAVLNIDPDNAAALEGIFNLAEGYAYMAKIQLDKQNYDTAKRYIDKGLTIQDNNEWLMSLQSETVSKLMDPSSAESSVILDSFVFDE